MRLLHRWLVVVGRSNDPFNGVFEDHVGDLIARYQCSGQGAAIDGDNEDFLCKELSA